MNPKISLLNLGTTKTQLAAVEAPDAGFDDALRQAQTPKDVKPPEAGPPDPDEDKAPPGSKAGGRPEPPDKPTAAGTPDAAATAEGEVAIQEPNAPSQTPDLLPRNNRETAAAETIGLADAVDEVEDPSEPVPTTEQWVLSLTAETGAGMFQVLPVATPRAMATVPTVVLGDQAPTATPTTGVAPVEATVAPIVGVPAPMPSAQTEAPAPAAPNPGATAGPILDSDEQAVLPTSMDSALPAPTDELTAATPRADQAAATAATAPAAQRTPPTAAIPVPGAPTPEPDANQTRPATNLPPSATPTIADVARQVGFASEEIVAVQALAADDPAVLDQPENLGFAVADAEQAPAASKPSAQDVAPARPTDPNATKFDKPKPPVEPGTQTKHDTETKGDRTSRGDGAALATGDTDEKAAVASNPRASRVQITTTDLQPGFRPQGIDGEKILRPNLGSFAAESADAMASDALAQATGSANGTGVEAPRSQPGTPLQPTPVIAPSSTQPTTQEAKLPVEVSDRIAMQIGERLEMLVATRPRSAVRVQLDPVDLGSLTITVKSRGASVDAHVTASNEQVRAALEMQRPQLIQQLDNRGLQLNSLNVGSQSSNGQTPSDGMPRQNAGQPAPSAHAGSANETVAANPAPTRALAAAHGRGVDLVI